MLRFLSLDRYNAPIIHQHLDSEGYVDATRDKTPAQVVPSTSSSTAQIVQNVAALLDDSEDEELSDEEDLLLI